MNTEDFLKEKLYETFLNILMQYTYISSLNKKSFTKTIRSSIKAIPKLQPYISLLCYVTMHF